MWQHKGAAWSWAGAHRLCKGRSVWLRWDAAWDRAGALRRTAQGRSVGPRRGAACGCAEAQPRAGLGRNGCARGAAWGCAQAERGAAQGVRHGAVRGCGMQLR